MIGRGTALVALVVSAVGFACSSGATKPLPTPVDPPTDTTVADAAFNARAEAYDAWYKSQHPGWAVDHGYHEQDGVLTDISREAIAARAAAYKTALADFEAMSGLGSEREYERQILLHSLRGAIFNHDVERDPFTNPMGYAFALEFTSYISRDYAPASDRARAMIKACGQAPAYYAQAAANLEAALAKTMVDTALLITTGTISFLKEDVVTAMSALPKEEKAALTSALGTCVEALEGYATLLGERAKTATDDFAIGEEAFLRMLADSEGLSITLPELEAIGAADLARNLASLKAAGEKLAPGKPLAEAVALSSGDKPAPAAVLELAADQSSRMKQFLLDQEIVSIPSDDVAETQATPPFLRWNFAFLSSPGAFEKKTLPSFYYISPPDPSWSPEMQRNYLASRSDLLFVTIHEVWPGHFLHYLHAKQSKSKIARSFCTYSMSEGWAHYTEEMMWDAGVGAGDPKVHIGQLQNALLRNVRFISAIGLHTKGMTVAESKKMFIESGFQDEGNATQQAVRGTFDPGYLNYTLGKLMIRKLHDDWRAAQGEAYSLKAFHDQFLAYQCAPVPVIRQLMLPGDTGSPL